MHHVTITSMCYHQRYHTFSLNLAWFGRLFNALPRVIVKFMKKNIYEYFFKRLMVARGNALQIAQNQANVR